MLADLKEYRPAKIDFVLDDKVKEEFKDVMVLCKGAKSSKEVLKVFRERFNCLFPEGELATRQYDAHEIAMIREEYCLKEENDVPKRKQELQETLEAIKAMILRNQRTHTLLLIHV